LIQQVTPIIQIDSVNSEDNKGIEIYDEDINSKKYLEQIKYFRNIIDEYEQINKQIGIYLLININEINLTDNKKNISVEYIKNELLPKLVDEQKKIYDYANDILIKFFVDSNITDLDVNKYMEIIYKMDIDFKEIFTIVDAEFNIINRLIEKIKECEEKLLIQMECAEKEANNNFIKTINEKLEIVMEYDSFIYKISNGYEQFDYTKIQDIINELNML
jgi:hypothetical protein